MRQRVDSHTSQVEYGTSTANPRPGHCRRRWLLLEYPCIYSGTEFDGNTERWVLSQPVIRKRSHRSDRLHYRSCNVQIAVLIDIINIAYVAQVSPNAF